MSKDLPLPDIKVGRAYWYSGHTDPIIVTEVDEFMFYARKIRETQNSVYVWIGGTYHSLMSPISPLEIYMLGYTNE